jgi:hypothetical protein
VKKLLECQIVEVTKDNEQLYLKQIAGLELKVLERMEEEGKSGQLFITGEEDISSYIHSKENTVMVAVDANGTVVSAVYITQGQKPFTYNDITKYFKYGDEYQKYVKSKYVSENHYKNQMLDIYKVKLEAFEYAKKRVLEEYPQFNGDIEAFLQHELNAPENGFHEKSVLREKLNQYMSEYIEEKDKSNAGLKKLYEEFYWITLEDISREFKKNKDEMKQNKTTKEYELLQSGNKANMQYQAIIKSSRT